ncbi:mechanosensitive ion channel family protein [Roseobacter weihaiensis]|uniref:mechanosensitive ion channel family protein n=1 Tax=Roseobacter weihaiensis TaxID=2763262 RepID=UPI001D0BB2E4|nr:mechanosensitive ion channel family protein [Roseobacter sp. H9]
MRAPFIALFLSFSVLLLAFAPETLQAQGIGSLFQSDEPEAEEERADRISDIMEKAAQNGVGVVVIDTNGNIVSTAAEPDPPANAPPVQAGSSALMQTQDTLVQFRATLIQRFLDFPNDFNEVLYILRATSPDGTIWAFFTALYTSLFLFGIGMIVEKKVYGRYIARGFVVSRSKDDPVGYAEKMPFLVFRFFMGVIGILVSMAVAYIIGAAVFGPLEDAGMQFTVGIINTAYFLSRLVAGLWRMILSPYLPQYRIPLLSTRDARHLYYWLVALGTFDIFRLLFTTWVKELGLNYDVYVFMAAVSGAIVVLLNILMLLVMRRPLTHAIRQGAPSESRTSVVKIISSVWLAAAIFYILYAWVQGTYGLVIGDPPKAPLIAGAYAILLSILVVYGVINFVIERSFARARAIRTVNTAPLPIGIEGQGPEESAAQAAPAPLPPPQRMNTFEGLARRIAGILAFVAGIYAFFYIWDNNSTQMVESFANRLLDVMVILFIGYIVYHVFRIWIDKKIEEEQSNGVEAELGDEGGGSSASRLATLLPLFRNFILVVLMVTILLIVLMEMGINVGPLFAGAGVVGVAVGFGSQALVRDIFSGGFFLFDDAFRKGEYLDVGGVKGTVEKISVRSFQLRHHLGALHTIPFGEIQVMTNYSRDWVIMKLPLRVTYDTDVEKVRKLIKNLGIALLDDPVIGDNFIQPLKSQGVIEMQDSAMIIRVKFMTKPGDQWLVRKKVYEEIRSLFEREGIHFAHKEVTVRLADGKVDELSEDDKKAITAAAQASIEEDMLEGGVEDGDDR